MLNANLRDCRQGQDPARLAPSPWPAPGPMTLAIPPPSPATVPPWPWRPPGPMRLAILTKSGPLGGWRARTRPCSEHP